MPTALTILRAYEQQETLARGAGLAGLEVRAALAPRMRALRAVIDADHDPRSC